MESPHYNLTDVTVLNLATLLTLSHFLRKLLQFAMLFFFYFLF